MARYIDAEALIKKIFPYDTVDKAQYSINAKAVYEAIQSMPTEGVVEEAKHGEWMLYENPVTLSYQIKCSLCGYKKEMSRNELECCPPYKCPNCEAKMDGERKGE